MQAHPPIPAWWAYITLEQREDAKTASSELPPSCNMVWAADIQVGSSCAKAPPVTYHETNEQNDL